MKLSIENLTEANRNFVATEWENPFNGLTQALDAPMPDGALYLPLDVTGEDIALLSGELKVGESPFLMVVGSYPCLKEVGEDEYEDVEGFAVQYFSKVMPGMMSGYETSSDFDELITFLKEQGIDTDSDKWFAAPRAW